MEFHVIALGTVHNRTRTRRLCIPIQSNSTFNHVNDAWDITHFTDFIAYCSPPQLARDPADILREEIKKTTGLTCRNFPAKKKPSIHVPFLGTEELTAPIETRVFPEWDDFGKNETALVIVLRYEFLANDKAPLRKKNIKWFSEAELRKKHSQKRVKSKISYALGYLQKIEK